MQQQPAAVEPEPAVQQRLHQGNGGHGAGPAAPGPRPVSAATVRQNGDARGGLNGIEGVQVIEFTNDEHGNRVQIYH